MSKIPKVLIIKKRKKKNEIQSFKVNQDKCINGTKAQLSFNC